MPCDAPVYGDPAIRASVQALLAQAPRPTVIFTNGGNPTVVIEACTNLVSAVWLPVATNTLTGGSSYCRDAGWTNHPARFYRFQMP